MARDNQPAARSSQTPLVELPCACANLRRATRAVTQLYDSFLRPVGLRTSQFTLLKVLAQKGPIRQGLLGELLALDSTTLTRSLRPLREQGWIKVREGDDRRERLLSLTRNGRRQLEVGAQEWKQAQKRLEKTLGKAQWRELFALTHRVATLSRES